MAVLAGRHFPRIFPRHFPIYSGLVMRSEKQFAKVPLSAIQDDRLTPRQFRVLCALLSIATRGVGTVWALRETIAERANVHVSHITRCTTALAKLGWIEKTGDGGHSKCSSYIIKVTYAKSAQVNGAETYAKTAQGPYAKTAQGPYAKTAQGNKQTILNRPLEQTNAHTARVPAWVSNALRTKLPEWIKPATWQAFVEHRRELGAKLTTQGIQGTLDQLDRMRQAGQQPAKVIEQSILKGWTGLFDLATTTRTRTAPADVNTLVAQGERIGVYSKPGESAQEYAARIQREAARRVH